MVWPMRGDVFVPPVPCFGPLTPPAPLSHRPPPNTGREGRKTTAKSRGLRASSAFLSPLSRSGGSAVGERGRGVRGPRRRKGLDRNQRWSGATLPPDAPPTR